MTDESKPTERSGMMPAEKWAQTSVAKASRYYCAKCGQRFDSPHAVYDHLDAEHGKKGAKP